MWSVTNYTLQEKDLFNTKLVVKIENRDNENLIKSMGLFVSPSRLKDLIPFSDPKDKIEEKEGSIAMMQHSTIMLAIKLRNKENVSYIYDILKKMNDDYVDKAKQQDKEFNKPSKGFLDLSDCIYYIPILSHLDIEEDIYVRGDMIYSEHKNIQLTFEELAKHNLIDKELFMQVYEDFAKKINQCL